MKYFIVKFTLALKTFSNGSVFAEAEVGFRHPEWDEELVKKDFLQNPRIEQVSVISYKEVSEEEYWKIANEM